MEDHALDKIVAELVRRDGVSTEHATEKVQGFLEEVDGLMTSGVDVEEVFTEAFRLGSHYLLDLLFSR